MRVDILYFAWIRERIGKGEEVLDLPDAVVTAGDLLDHLKTLGEDYEAALEHDHVVRVAVNQELVERGDPIAGAREIAIFPPMTGG